MKKSMPGANVFNCRQNYFLRMLFADVDAEIITKNDLCENMNCRKTKPI